MLLKKEYSRAETVIILNGLSWKTQDKHLKLKTGTRLQQTSLEHKAGLQTLEETECS